MPLDRLERLTDLVLVLLHTRRPLPLDQIAREVPGYPNGPSARRQAFERDKRLLREEGIPLVTEPVEGPEQFGYRIDPDRYYLPDLDLDRDELNALHLAVAGVHLGDLSGRGGLLKLGASGMREPVPWASLAAPPYLRGCFEALRTRARLWLEYRGSTREISPGGLWFRRGRWYLVAWDHGVDAPRTFRVDRVEREPAVDAAGSAGLPDDFDPRSGVPGEPWRVGEGDEQRVQVRVDAIEAQRVIAEVGETSVVRTRSDGGVIVEFGATNFTALRSWLLSLLDHAELIAPPGWRAQLAAWLRAMAEPSASAAVPGSDSSNTPDARPAAAPGAGGAGQGALAEVGLQQRPHEMALRLQRLLAMVGWLAKAGDATIDEVADRFGLAPDDVVSELELAACCGLPPYTPDALMEIVVTEDRVRATLPDELARPRRLAPAEGLAIIAAVRTILAIPGADQAGALARALAKLEDAMGHHQQVSVDLDEPLLLPEVRHAVTTGQRLSISYHSLSSDRTRARIIDPRRLLAIDGHWYLDGTERDGGALRRFRVDRILALRATGERVAGRSAEPAHVQPGPAFVPGPDAVPTRLRLSAAAEWVLDTVPVEDARPLEGGGYEVTLYVGGIAWLERLLLQLGPEGAVAAPPELGEVGPLAARRLLERYEDPWHGEKVDPPV